MSTDEMKTEFSQSLQTAAEQVWARFRDVMPPRYFKETDAETQLSHLHVLAACEATGVEQDLVLRSNGGNTWTFLTGRSFPGQLGEMLSRLPDDRSLTAARAYTSTDGQWVLDIFELGETGGESLANEEFQSLLAQLSSGLAPEYKVAFSDHLAACAPEYVRAVPTKIAQVHFHLVQEARQNGAIIVDWEDIEPSLDTVRMMVEGTEAKFYFQRLARFLGQRGIDIERAYVTSFSRGAAPFRYLGFTLRGTSKENREQITQDLKRLYYVDETVLDLWSEIPNSSLQDCEIMDFFITLAQQLICQNNAPKYIKTQLIQVVLKNSELMLDLVSKFRAKQAFKLDSSSLALDVECEFFDTCSQIQGSVREHNLSQESRQALGAILAVELFVPETEQQPYSVLFAKGRGHKGFHVRFQDVARGGMRLVCPRSVEAHSRESARLFQEAYNLARAQHLKNKDIPEGGAKAAVLVAPGGDATFCGQCFANTLLDLTVGLSSKEDKQPDLIYLGPDENVTKDLIEWITDRAKLRNHPLPSAFMSSKPGAGINHKEFGITSEGVTVFLERALPQIGIDPKSDIFTVKITGGPDGDVAGNEIRILAERYPDTAKIVGVGDGSGVAEDPEGLDHQELVRLFSEVSPIAKFDPQKLSAQGRVVSVNEPEGVQLRNTLHNRLVTDAFVPAGGRPNTISAENWQDFLTADGQPSSRLIVEGANLFLTAEARRELSALGTLIIKDSSANKCGVICSSFEVLASMLLSESEFLEHKKEFVGEVIERLRFLAQCEADLLFNEHQRRPDLSLTELSIDLSRVMLKTAEAVALAADDPLNDNEGGTRDLLLNYLPPLLRRVAGDRLQQIPQDYRKRIVACSLAGKIVYREGITYLKDMPPAALSELALSYLRSDLLVNRLIEEVKNSDLKSSDQLAKMLSDGGARTLARALSDN